MDQNILERSLTSIEWLTDLKLAKRMNEMSSGQLGYIDTSSMAKVDDCRNNLNDQLAFNTIKNNPGMIYSNNPQISQAPLTTSSQYPIDHQLQQQVIDVKTNKAVQEFIKKMKSSQSENPEDRPNFSYQTLTASAILESDNGKLSLTEIYDWIMENFPYYKSAGTSWKNSVRHNLSFSKLFKRVQRNPSSEPGKGAFWAIDPEYMHQINFFLTDKRKSVARRRSSGTKPYSPTVMRSSSISSTSSMTPVTATVTPTLQSPQQHNQQISPGLLNHSFFNQSLQQGLYHESPGSSILLPNYIHAVHQEIGRQNGDVIPRQIPQQQVFNFDSTWSQIPGNLATDTNIQSVDGRLLSDLSRSTMGFLLQTIPQTFNNNAGATAKVVSEDEEEAFDYDQLI